MQGRNSLPSLRSFAQERLIKDMLSSADVESGKKGKKPLGYILILDDYTLNIVNSVVEIKELIDQKIVGVEKISIKRKAFHKMQAIYFLEPIPENIELVAQDVQGKLYDSIHLYFTRAVPDRVFSSLKAQQGIISSLVSFKELNLDFLVIDDCQFSLGMEGLYTALFQREDQQTITGVAEKLYTLLSVFLPTSNLEVISERGSIGEKVATAVRSIFMNIHGKHAAVVSKDTAPIRLVVLDSRGFDVKTPAIHEFTYLSMVQDLADIKKNVVEFDTQTSNGDKIRRKCVLDETDELWTQYRFKHIAEVVKEHNQNFQDFCSKNSTAKLQKGQMKDMDLNKMQSIVRDMPQYAELLTRYGLHFFLSEQVLGRFNGKGLKETGDIEQTVCTGVDSNNNNPSSSDIFSAVMREMTNPRLSKEEKLRLAILTLSSLHLSDSNLSKLKSQLTDPSDQRAFDNVIYLRVRNESSLGSTKSKLSSEEKKQYEKISKSSKYFLQRFVPKLTFLLEQLYAGRLNSSLYSSHAYPGGVSTKKLVSNELVSLRTRGLKEGTSIQNKEKLIVFVVGGLSYSEIRAVKDLGRQG